MSSEKERKGAVGGIGWHVDLDQQAGEVDCKVSKTPDGQQTDGQTDRRTDPPF